jgi:hypothetical protein
VYGSPRKVSGAEVFTAHAVEQELDCDGAMSENTPEPISDNQARAEGLACWFCTCHVGLERAWTIAGREIIRCRDVMACDRRWREQNRKGRARNSH